MRRTALVFVCIAFVTGCPENQESPNPMTAADAQPPNTDAHLPDGSPPDSDVPDAAMADATPIMDANTPDADAPDANTPDADAPDADTPDADAPDADAPDADTPDADGQDGGSHDASALDAAPADAAVVDAEMPDAAAEPPAPAIVALDGTGDYLDLASALAAPETDIIVRAGIYEVDRPVFFEHADTTVRGEDRDTVRFVQTAQDQDLFVVRADGVTVSNLTLDTTNAGQAAFVEQGANGITLEDSVIRGGDQIFTLYFAGPEVAAGAETLAAYSTGMLSRGNRILRNTITSRFVGDSVAFALQTGGEVRDNTLDTGLMALYMVQNVTCAGNTITGSPTNGIFISLPSTNLTVTDNVVVNSNFSAIVVKPQVEHDAAGLELDSEGIVIEENTLTTQLFGIEIDGTAGDPSQGRFVGPLIRGNTIEMDDFAGIYMVRVEEPALIENIITFTGADPSRRGVDDHPAIADMLSTGVYLDLEVTSPMLERNVITRTAVAADPRVMQNAIVLHADSVTNATVRENTFRRHGDDWVHSPCAQDLGANDRDGVYDLTQGPHLFEDNLCEPGLP